MKLDRLLAITIELMTKKRVTATELAARFEVSVRTIYRDVELINQAGIPVVSFTGADGGFELMEGFFLTKQHFSVKDFSVIYNLLKSTEGAIGGKYTALVQKLGSLQPALLNGGNNESIIFNLSTVEGEKTALHPLSEAIQQNRVTSFSYRSASGTVSERRVEPLRLFWERGAWYLQAYCLWRQANRIFRLSRITALEVTEVIFQLRKDQTSQDEEETEDFEGTLAHLRFDPSVGLRVVEQFPGECTHHGTHIDLHKIFYKRDYAMSVVLSYGSKVEIISPDDLKEYVLKEIKEIQQRYQ
ncbi:YafY family protein [Brevibacillus fortis]|uniref:helix-turn-helix transcriptional regulator n=1 Tax=Brevibacillus fortis TaxID=2126352 RepID=UPI002E1FAABB|nr:YafY family protein [Brevibacillus fortis]